MKTRSMNDLVSVVMPSYNTGKYIKKSIESVLAQTYRDWELLIVDDGSTDDTDAIISSFDDPRIRYFKNETNSGAAICRNLALREAKGRWIAFLDSDDIWLPEKLEKQIAFMKKNDYDFSYTGYYEINEESLPTGTHISGPSKIGKAGMFRYCWPGCLTVMYDAEKIGLIQVSDIKKNNDYAMWLQVCKKAACYLLNEELAQYRRGRQGSISTNRYMTLIKWHYTLFREAENESALISAYHTLGNLIFGVIKKVRYVSRDEKCCR